MHPTVCPLLTGWWFYVSVAVLAQQVKVESSGRPLTVWD